MKHITILNVPIAVGSTIDFEKIINSLLRRSSAAHIITVNPEILVQSYYDARYRSILQRADLATADGVGIILLGKLAGHRVRLSERMTGVALTRILLDIAESLHANSMIIIPRNSLSSPSEIYTAIHKLHPHINLKISVDGTVQIREINDFKPLIIFVTLGAPRQERWIYQNLSALSTAKICIGVGGTFDFISGKIKRAPHIIQSIGLEWFWRCVIEPKRLGRILRAVIIFPFLVIKNR